MTFEECIAKIRILPDLRLAAHGILIPPSYNQPDKEIIFRLRIEYESVADWLEYYWLNKLHQVTLLTNTVRLDYKTHAERIMSFKKLAEQLILTPSWIDNCCDPVVITFSCATQICESQLFNSGFFSTEASQIGSRENYKRATKYYKYLKNVDDIDFVKEESFLYPIQALESCAANEAFHDKFFRDNYYREYIREQKSYHRTLDKSELLVFRLHNGEPEFSSRGVAPGRSRKFLCKD